MINRIGTAFVQVLSFLRNPVEHLAGDESDYKSLRDIVAVILLIGFPLVVFKISSDVKLFSIYFVVVVLLVWPLSWVVLNFSAYIFNYFLQWVSYKKILDFQPDLLTTQRIVAYTLITILISAIPVPHINYVRDIATILLTGIGLKVLYGLKISHGIGVALAYQVILFLILYTIKLLLQLVG